MQSTSVSADAKFPDAVWQTIKDYLREYKDYDAPDKLREILEHHADVRLFDGGAFVAVGNEFDLFVVPEKRGRWRIRTEIGKYLEQMGRVHGKLVVRINERNTPSLRLARHFGFKEVSRNDGVVRLENDSWVTLSIP